jgi:hypothetical protein
MRTIMGQGCDGTRGVVIRFERSKMNKSCTSRTGGHLTGLARFHSDEGAVRSEIPPATELGGAEQSDLLTRIERAMREWEERDTEEVRPTPRLDRDVILKSLPGLLVEIRNDFGLNHPVEDQRARRALLALHGDAALRHLALMTPQGILALPGCGRSVLDRVIRELSKVSAMTIPELVTRTGKAGLTRVSLSDLSVGLDGLLSAPSASALPSRPRLI